MMLNERFPARFRIACIIVVVLFCYILFYHRERLNQPLWGSQPPNSATRKATEKTQPKDGSVVLVTASAGTAGFQGIPNLKEMVYENRMTYANKWGYEHMWANITSYSLPNGEPVVWNKIPVLQEAFARYPEVEWVWWLDLDIIIMNMSLSLGDHVLSPEGMARNAAVDEIIRATGGSPSGWKTPKTYDYNEMNFIIASGGWGMNAGSFLMRRSDWSDWLLDLWIEPLYIKENFGFAENGCWTHMYRNHAIVRKHTLLTHQRVLNAYPEFNPNGEHWQPGDHSIHFAGCGDHSRCPGEWNKYWNLRENYTVPDALKQKLRDGTAEIENIQKGVGLPEL